MDRENGVVMEAEENNSIKYVVYHLQDRHLCLLFFATLTNDMTFPVAYFSS